MKEVFTMFRLAGDRNVKRRERCRRYAVNYVSKEKRELREREARDEVE